MSRAEPHAAGGLPAFVDPDDDLMELCSQPVILLDLSGEMRRWNAAARDLYGPDRGPGSGRRIEALLASPIARTDADAQAALRKDGVWSGALQRQTASGAVVDVQVRWTLRLDEDGAPVGVVEFGCAETVAEATARLRAGGDRYRQMFTRAPIALMLADARGLGAFFKELEEAGVTDLAGHIGGNPDLLGRAIDCITITEANEQAVLLFGGTSASELAGSIRPMWQDAPDTFHRALTARINGEPYFSEETKIRTLDGRVVDILFSLAFVSTGDLLRASLLGMVDITERLETEAQLRAVSADFANAASLSALGELTASIGHEIKQPLSAILTNAQTTQRWLTRDTPNLEKGAQLLARVAESARRGSDIIDRVQDAAGNRPPIQASLDLNEVVRESLRFVRQDSDDGEVQIHLDLVGDLPPILGDRVLLQQVVVNLLSNSFQAMRNGERAREVFLTTSVRPSGEVFLSTRDTGPGVPQPDLGRIFEGFFTTKDDGLGIGLAICRAIVTAHGGTITVANDPAGGACFCIEFPPLPAIPPHTSVCLA